MAGSSLERHLGQIAYRAGVGSYAKAETNFSHIGLFYLKMQKGSNSEEICELLLHYARCVVPILIGTRINPFAHATGNRCLGPTTLPFNSWLSSRSWATFLIRLAVDSSSKPASRGERSLSRPRRSRGSDRALSTVPGGCTCTISQRCVC